MGVLDVTLPLESERDRRLWALGMRSPAWLGLVDAGLARRWGDLRTIVAASNHMLDALAQPVTATGTVRWVVLLSPSCPLLFHPQAATVPSEHSARL